MNKKWRMNKMKKTLSIIIALALILVFAVGCGNDNDSSAKESSDLGAAADQGGSSAEFDLKSDSLPGSADSFDTEGISIDDFAVADNPDMMAKGESLSTEGWKSAADQ
jgi:hypothetical protein